MPHGSAPYKEVYFEVKLNGENRIKAEKERRFSQMAHAVPKPGRILNSSAVNTNDASL